MANLSTTTQGVFQTLFKYVPDNLIESEWTPFRIPFHSKSKCDRGLQSICFKHSVGNTEMIIYTSCIPEFLDTKAIRKDTLLEMPFYAMGTKGFYFDYKKKNHEFGNMGAIFIVIKQGEHFTYVKPLKYVGHIADRIKANQSVSKSICNRFKELLEEAHAVALPLFEKERKRLEKRSAKVA